MPNTMRTSGDRIVNDMVFDPNIYGKLLANTLPGVIADGEEYAKTEQIFDRLISKGEKNLSPEEFRLFELLANLLEEYENRILPPLPNSTPAENLDFLMQQNDLKQNDLVDVFGSQAVVSKVLSGKRSISKSQAKLLGKKFNISVQAFI